MLRREDRSFVESFVRSQLFIVKKASVATMAKHAEASSHIADESYVWRETTIAGIVAWLEGNMDRILALFRLLRRQSRRP